MVQKSDHQEGMDDRISVIISTFSTKRYNDLIDLFQGLSAQTYKNIEVIVIIDENVELYERLSQYIKSNNLTNISVVLNQKNYGLSYSRNLGVRMASGSIVAYIDDDALPFPEWAEQIKKTFEDMSVGAVTGDVLPLWEEPSMSWFPKEIRWLVSCSYIMTPDQHSEVERGFGVNMAFRKELFQEIGVFDTNLGISGNRWIGGEDTDMFLRISEAGKKVIFNPQIRVLHKVPKTRISITNISKRAFNGGTSVAVMRKIRPYRIRKSTEKQYLSRILFEFYPNAFRKVITQPSKALLKQIVYVSAVMAFQPIGFFYGNLKSWRG
jgi:GT2 family glycosyltransferase